MKNKLYAILAVGLLAGSMAVPAAATMFNLQALIDGAQANAGVGTGSLGTGVASVTYDDATSLFSWDVSWSGLTGNVTVAHFHGPAAPGVNAGVQVPIVAVSPSIGSILIDATQAADLLADLWYINIHSDVNPGGEIRGQVTLVQVPEPTILALFGLGLAGLGFARRKKA